MAWIASISLSQYGNLTFNPSNQRQRNIAQAVDTSPLVLPTLSSVNEVVLRSASSGSSLWIVGSIPYGNISPISWFTTVSKPEPPAHMNSPSPGLLLWSLMANKSLANETDLQYGRIIPFTMAAPPSLLARHTVLICIPCSWISNHCTSGAELTMFLCLKLYSATLHVPVSKYRLARAQYGYSFFEYDNQQIREIRTWLTIRHPFWQLDNGLLELRQA